METSGSMSSMTCWVMLGVFLSLRGGGKFNQ